MSRAASIDSEGTLRGSQLGRMVVTRDVITRQMLVNGLHQEKLLQLGDSTRKYDRRIDRVFLSSAIGILLADHYGY